MPVWEPVRNLNIYLCMCTIVSGQTQRRMWIKNFNLKDGGCRDKDRDIWERRGSISIKRASSFAHKHNLTPPLHTHTEKKRKLSLVCTCTHYACKAFIVQPGCRPEDPSPTDWVGWRDTARQRRVPAPSTLFEINHTGFHIQHLFPGSPTVPLLQQWQWAWASSPTESPHAESQHPGVPPRSPCLWQCLHVKAEGVKLLLDEDHKNDVSELCLNWNLWDLEHSLHKSTEWLKTFWWFLSNSKKAGLLVIAEYNKYRVSFHNLPTLNHL